MAADGTADLEALKAALNEAEAGDLVMLHGCCHNPTGVDYTPAQWDEIAPLLAAKGVLPLIDLAYQGLGEGMEADAYGLRTVLWPCPRRWSPIRATRTSVSTATASARSMW
jgi:aromatic-amino-acid transaminase